MFTKAIYIGVLLVFAGAAGFASAEAGTPPVETVDEYAQRILQQGADASRRSKANAVVAVDAPAARAEHASPAVRVLFISGAGARRSAYLMLDGVYGKSVTQRDSVGGWHVRAIGSDYVDVERDSERQRLLLPVRPGGARRPASAIE